jgi:hypothetical protein
MGHFFFVTDLTICCFITTCFQWVPVTTAWRIIRLQVEEWPPIWRVAANILNKQWRTADEGWSSSLGVGRGADNSSPLKQAQSRNIQTCLHCSLVFVILSTVHMVGFNVSSYTTWVQPPPPPTHTRARTHARTHTCIITLCEKPV